MLENRTKNSIRTINCILLENLRYENIKLQHSKKLSEIEYLDNCGTIITEFSTGNAFQNIKMCHCYIITSTTYIENEQCSKKRKR